MRKLILALLSLALIGGLVVFGRSLASTDAPERDRPIERVGISTALPELPQERKISVYPAPGVRSASPETQLSFRGAPAGELGEIGSPAPGAGRTVASCARTPTARARASCRTKPFVAGERVTVRTRARHHRRRGRRRSRSRSRGGRRSRRSASRNRRARDAAPRRVRHPPGPHPARRHHQHRQAGPRARPGVRGPEGRPRPRRPDDRRRHGAAGLVQADAEGPRRRRLPGADLQGQACDHVVAGRPDRRRRPRRRRRSTTSATAASRPCASANGYPMDLHEFTITPQGTALLMSYDRVIRTCARSAARATPS